LQSPGYLKYIYFPNNICLSGSYTTRDEAKDKQEEEGTRPGNKEIGKRSRNGVGKKRVEETKIRVRTRKIQGLITRNIRTVCVKAWW
jgi:hypothetical protein